MNILITIILLVIVFGFVVKTQRDKNHTKIVSYKKEFKKYHNPLLPYGKTCEELTHPPYYHHSDYKPTPPRNINYET